MKLALPLALAALLAAPASAQDLFTMPPAGVESRWASPENPTGEKGRVLRAGVVPLWRLNQIVEPRGVVIEGPEKDEKE